jgi:hypothetical protein
MSAALRHFALTAFPGRRNPRHKPAVVRPGRPWPRRLRSKWRRPGRATNATYGRRSIRPRKHRPSVSSIAFSKVRMCAILLLLARLIRVAEGVWAARAWGILLIRIANI